MASAKEGGPVEVVSAPAGGSRLYVYLLTVVAALGALLFGYDTAVISGANESLQTRFQLDELGKGWVASSALIGCILGAASAGTLSDRFGRKMALLVSAVLFSVSAIGSALPRNLVEFVIARMIGGVGVGTVAMLSPLYISEVAPAEIRGRLVSIYQFAIVFGMFVVYYVNAQIGGLYDESWRVETGWRWMFGSETLPAAVFLVLLFFVPESPRWLTKQGKKDRALAILTRANGAEHARREIAEIEDAIAHESESLRQLFQPSLRAPLWIGIMLAILQQVTGINAVLYYAPTIFQSAGLEETSALNHAVSVGLVNMGFTLIAMWLVDKVGRKPLLIAASAGMCISLTFLGMAFQLQQFDGPWILIFVLAYVASFATAMGPVVWIVISEIFPTRIRGRAMSVATVCLWIACYCVSQFFPFLLATISGSVFFLYAILCFLTIGFVDECVPETKGKTLEEIEKGWMGEELQS